MDELISRQQAIDALKTDMASLDHIIKGMSAYDVRLDAYVSQRNQVNCDIDTISNLPPAQPEQRWIPCSERLPEDEYVLISKKPTKISGDKWCVAIAIRMSDPRSRKIQWRDSGFGVIQDDKVLAWMPLPEPYQEGEQE